ncbi:MAG: hypothetical protein GFH27_549285n240 [Chloroflexi bacterium AL-W]|nr:hypothetical protein [Chloroflexi bacterium AL-N1]NOK65752.1 hypothetical protein [Chloroflexi bacterium AL-N10]NOK74307.1 hypothetical protein [Chloroflexi bacterium AL-N5]NOK80785.1 hypothetical protein [Chloroflexi bacterium AL-W]NOK88565.1 hypothetical protein [Chloroflexi bacterium AL-N15]
MPAIVTGVSVILTIMVLSRIAGDLPVLRVIHRVAQYLFVGVSLGLAFVITYHQVVFPSVRQLSSGESSALLIYGVPFLLGMLLLPRLSNRQAVSWLANIPLALVFGVGAALAIGGAVIGTLSPQILDIARRPLEGDPATMAGVVVLALGTVATLCTFYYTVPREDTSVGRLIAVAALIGHWLLMIAFGFFFASAIQTYMSALIERLQFLLSAFGIG